MHRPVHCQATALLYYTQNSTPASAMVNMNAEVRCSWRLLPVVVWEEGSKRGVCGATLVCSNCPAFMICIALAAASAPHCSAWR